MISPDGMASSRMVGGSASVIFPCTIKSKRRFLLAPAHPGNPGKRAVKWPCMFCSRPEPLWTRYAGFLQAVCPYCHRTNSVKALKKTHSTKPNQTFSNPKWRMIAISKTVKLQYLGNILTDLHEIWHCNTYWPSLLYRPLKYRTSEDPRWWMTTILKIVKLTYLSNSFRLVSWSLTSLFSTNMAISETK